ncbi:MAG: competence/damage-inducible protein A [Vicingaceae bacterium]
MSAGIITIGDELLIGETVNTNSSWMAKALDNAGMDVGQMITVGDNPKEIAYAVRSFLSEYELVLITGGLGPTHDDITKVVLADLFDDQLVFNQKILDDVTALLSRFGRVVNELNKEQAMVPSKCVLIRNERGTAPGMIFEESGKYLVSMPGVPGEMKHMMKKAVLPLLSEKLNRRPIVHRHIRSFGVGESELATVLNDVINQMNPLVKLAFLPSAGHVKIRLSVKGEIEKEAKALIMAEEKNILDLIGDHCFGFDGESLEGVVGSLLKVANKTLSTAESCTGGMLASKITSIPGSSVYFKGSIIAYNNQVKTDMLGVSESDLVKHGAVSEEVVLQMARGARDQMKTDYGLATSGIAGPDGGTEDKPVGTIWIAITGNGFEKSVKLSLGFNRLSNMSLTCDHVLNLLRKELKKSLD